MGNRYRPPIRMTVNGVETYWRAPVIWGIRLALTGPVSRNLGRVEVECAAPTVFFAEKPNLAEPSGYKDQVVFRAELLVPGKVPW